MQIFNSFNELASEPSQLQSGMSVFNSDIDNSADVSNADFNKVMKIETLLKKSHSFLEDASLQVSESGFVNDTSGKERRFSPTVKRIAEEVILLAKNSSDLLQRIGDFQTEEVGNARDENGNVPDSFFD